MGILQAKSHRLLNKKSKLISGRDKNKIYKILTTIIPITTQAKAIRAIGFI